MDRFLRLASIALIAAGIAACDDDTATPQGDPSTVNVSVYIEDSENTDGDGDDPIAGATVTLTSTEEGGETFSGTTNAEGVATFTNVPAGVYTLTHELAAPITKPSSVRRETTAAMRSGESLIPFLRVLPEGTFVQPLAAWAR